MTIEVEATPIERTVIESETDNSAVPIPDETENENLTDLKTIQTLITKVRFNRAGRDPSLKRLIEHIDFEIGVLAGRNELPR